jgi:uncharacterized protein
MEIIYLLILAIGVGLGFYAQTIVGFAASLVAFPIILNILEIQEAVALMSIFFFIFSIILIYKNWNLINKKTIIKMLIGIIIGLLLGIWLLKFGNPVILKKILGAFILIFIGYSYLKKKRIKLFKKLGFLFGFIGGLFSGLFSTGGSPFIAYIYNELKDPDIIRATIIGTLGITNFLRVPILIYSGILTYNIFITALYIIPFFLLALFLGNKTYEKISKTTFKHVLMIFLALSAVSLIII